MVVWHWVTAWGDAAVMVPLAVGMAFCLFALAGWRLAVVWLAYVGPAMLAVAASKLAWLVWEIGLPGFAFRGMSGHALQAAVVLPVACWLAAGYTGRTHWLQPWLIGTAAAVLVAISRVRLGYHFPAEVIVGGALGSLLSASFLLKAASTRPVIRPHWAGLALCAALVAMQLGKRAATDEAIEQAAAAIRSSEPANQLLPVTPISKRF